MAVCIMKMKFRTSLQGQLYDRSVAIDDSKVQRRIDVIIAIVHIVPFVIKLLRYQVQSEAYTKVESSPEHGRAVRD